MSSYSLIVRFPNQTEYWYSATVPDVGDTIDRTGTRYVVTGKEQSENEQVIVTLEHDAEFELHAHPAADLV